MIQSVIPTLAVTPAGALEALLQPGTGTPELPDFAALLTLSAAPAVPADTAAALPVAPPAIADDLAAMQLQTAETGKSLPLALPQVAAPVPLVSRLPVSSAASTTAQPEAAAEAPTPLQAQAVAGQLAHPQRTGKTAHAAPRAPAARAAEKADLHPSELKPAAPASLPQVSLALGPIVADQTEPQSPLAEKPALDPAAAPTSVAMLPDFAVAASTEPALEGPQRQRPAIRGTPEPAAQAVAHAAPQAAFLRAALPPPVTPQPGPPAPASEPPPHAARAPGLLRVEIALPGAIEPAAKPLEKLQSEARRVVPSQPAPVATVLASAELPQLHTAPAATPPPLIASPRPHDFSALVDRLVAAREAVQPQGATLTVAHAEFGPVELRFRHEERGLAVSLTNADPDFVRAAAAAPPVNLSVSTGAFVPAEPGQSAAAREHASTAGGSASGQSRGQQSERRADNAQHSHHNSQRTSTRDTARRSGIFA